MTVRWIPNATATTPTVLVVDDEHMIRWSIEQTLSAAGYAVATAETGAAGLALVRQMRPDVVFLDVRLPDADGLSLLKQIRDECPRSAVIVMTAFNAECSADTAIREGATAYLSKPFNFDQLADRVRETLDRVCTP